MICITDVTYIEVDRDYHTISSFNLRKHPLILKKSTEPGNEPEQVAFNQTAEREIVQSQRFVDVNGREIAINK